MTSLPKWSALALAVACATGGHPPLEKLVDAQVTSIPVANDAEAVSVIDNKVRWLGFLFEQSRDPYYGTEKWPAPCLAANRIGARRTIPGGTVSLSRLLMNRQRRPGFCPTARDATEHVLLFVHCAGQAGVRELTVPATSWTLGEGEGLCR